MKEDLIEYHPNGRLKHSIEYYKNGNKYREYFFDNAGKCHRNNFPAVLKWYENNRLHYKIYIDHGKYHNSNNPADIYFDENEKIRGKEYYFNHSIKRPKLQWLNEIKNI